MTSTDEFRNSEEMPVDEIKQTAAAMSGSDSVPPTSGSESPTDSGSYAGANWQQGQPYVGANYGTTGNYGAPGNYGTPNYGAPGNYGTPNYGAPNYGAPNYSAPGYGAPNYGAPNYGAPGNYGAPNYGTPNYGAPGNYGTPGNYGAPGNYATAYGVRNGAAVPETFGTPLASRILLYIAFGLLTVLIPLSYLTGEYSYSRTFYWIQEFFALSGWIMMTVAISIRPKKIAPLFGAGLMLLATIGLVNNIYGWVVYSQWGVPVWSWVMNIFPSIIIIVFEILIAIHYFTKGNGINHKAKTAFAIINCALVMIVMNINLIAGLTVRNSYSIYITSYVSSIVSLLLWLAIAIHAPFKRR